MALRRDEVACIARVYNRPLNEGFVWCRQGGMQPVHAKVFLPDEEGVWEASWYHAAVSQFIPVQVGVARIGFLICTEIWAMEQARLYGEQGVDLIVTPRLTMAATLDKWLAAGRVAAVLAGAFGLSSNRANESGAFGGLG